MEHLKQPTEKSRESDPDRRNPVNKIIYKSGLSNPGPVSLKTRDNSGSAPNSHISTVNVPTGVKSSTLMNTKSQQGYTTRKPNIKRDQKQ